MSPNPLTEALFKETTEGKMTEVTKRPGRCIDVWIYVDLIRGSIGLPQQVFDDRLVHYVYRSQSGRYDHVLIPSGRYNVFLVIVVDRVENSVFGHHVLDLNAEFGLTKLGMPKL